MKNSGIFINLEKDLLTLIDIYYTDFLDIKSVYDYFQERLTPVIKILESYDLPELAVQENQKILRFQNELIQRYQDIIPTTRIVSGKHIEKFIDLILKEKEKIKGKKTDPGL